MKQVTIDLAGPFEEIIASLRSVPPTDDLNGRRNNAEWELTPEVHEVVRSIYEAARGRQFATPIGLVPAGPPPRATFLKDTSFKVVSQADFLLQTLARLYGGAYSKREAPPLEICRKTKIPKGEFPTNRSPRPQHDSLSHPIIYDNNHDEPTYSHHHASSKSERFSAPDCTQENHALGALRE
jgi:hypothetical protein